MSEIFFVATGGAIGAVLRYLVSIMLLSNGFVSRAFLATLFINTLGCLVMGFLTGIGLQSRSLQLFLATGILGGFTTFSAFGLESFTLIQEGDIWSAAIYGIASIAGGLLGIAAGYRIGNALL